MQKLFILSILWLSLAGMQVMAEEPAELSVEMSAIENTPTISHDGQVVRVQNAMGEEIHVYNVLGVEVFRSLIDGVDKTFALNLKRGCYIVKVGKTARKISIQ